MQDTDWNLLNILKEEKNITKAAARMYISQPAITYRIKHLEKEFQTKIIIRNKKGIEFTAEGDFLVNYFQDMLRQLNQAKDELQKMSGLVQGQLHLGVSSNFARYELPPLLKIFHKKYPKVEFNVKTGWSSEITQLLKKEEVHVGIVRGTHDWPYNKILLKTEPIKIVSTEPIEFKKLPSLKSIKYKTDADLRTIIDQWWQSHFNKPPLVNTEVDRIETCIEMVRNGFGYGIFPSISIPKNEPQLYMQDILDLEKKPILRPTYLMYRKHVFELAAIKAFIEFISSYKDGQG